MKVVLARIAGFCTGVKTAMRVAVDAARQYGMVTSHGPLIHNEQAVRLLELRGVFVSSEQPRPGETVLIRAHGMRPDDRMQLADKHCRLVDATCVHVAKNQRLAAEAARSGKKVMIAGDVGHAEVDAVLGGAGEDAVVIASAEDALQAESAKPVFLLAQTTFDSGEFQRLAAIVQQRFPGAEIRNTICLATERRQQETRRLAQTVDALVVVGGRKSANTRRLAEIGRELGKPSFLVETAAELEESAFAAFHSVGVTAGASTPGWITQAVVDKLRRFGDDSLAGKISRALAGLLESRVLVAMSAFGLALAAQMLLLRFLDFGLAAAAGLYVFFAHIVNRRVPYNQELRTFSGIDPFYNRHRRRLLAAAWLAAAAALALAWLNSVAALFFLAIFAALLHSRLVVEKMRLAALVRNLPGARAALTSLGWTLTIAGPAAMMAADSRLAGLMALAFVFLFRFAIILIRDLYDLDNDNLMGIETLAVAIGAARTGKTAIFFLRAAETMPFLLALWAVAVGAPFSPWLVFALLLACLPEAGVYLLEVGVGKSIRDPLAFQVALESLGCAAGLLALAARAAS